jgi:S-adenosylmethionine hydrolase
LLTDFGLKDSYVAEIKAVLLSRAPNVSIVDITHQVPKFSIRTGAFLLASAAPYFPDGTVHVAVVDPGVGSKRRAIAIQGKRFRFVGPDNGVLIPAARMDGPIRVHEIQNPKFMRETVSTTFHGRDVFAVTTALLAGGELVEAVGRSISDQVEPPYSSPRKVGNRVECEVVHADDFGNVITSVHGKDLAAWGIHAGNDIVVSIGRRRVGVPFLSTFSEVRKGGLVAMVGSHDFLEISVNQGDAARRLRLKPGARLVLEM